MADKWWLALKPGDRVYVPRERNKESGMAEVYSNGKKYIHVSLHGYPIRIKKSCGCTEDYPGFQICRDEKDHMDSVWQRKLLRDTVDGLSGLASSYKFRPTAEQVSKLQALYEEMVRDE